METVRGGCEAIRFDEPGWTAFPEEAMWAAEVLNQFSNGLGVKIGLHVCCGDARRKRAYTKRYHDLVEAFQTARIDQVVLEHCTLDYDVMTLWDIGDFRGEFAVSVVDQRRDDVETTSEIAARSLRAARRCGSG
jgi:methionine synthase II (cobalamin-independent)